MAGRLITPRSYTTQVIAANGSGSTVFGPHVFESRERARHHFHNEQFDLEALDGDPPATPVHLYTYQFIMNFDDHPDTVEMEEYGFFSESGFAFEPRPMGAKPPRITIMPDYGGDTPGMKKAAAPILMNSSRATKKSSALIRL
jgi:hypothetical protein